MKNKLKHTIPLFLALCALLLAVATPFAAMAEERTMTYNNVANAEMYAECTNGQLTINIMYAKANGVTASARIETYIEKRGFLGLFWTRVDIEPDNDMWVDLTSASSFSTQHSHSFASTGTYRVKTTFTVSGTGGDDDTIEKTTQIVY